MSEECTIIIKVTHDEYVKLTKYAEDDPIETSVNDYVRQLVRVFLEEAENIEDESAVSLEEHIEKAENEVEQNE